MATADTPASSGLSPKEEGELEDGEISDDDNNSQIRSRSSSSSSGGGLLPYPRRRPPHPARGGGSGGGGGSSSSSSSSQQQLRNFSRSRHTSERGHLRGHSSYRPKEPFRSHPPSVRMPSSSLSESSPRPSFWERSHIALDRFRFRGRPYRGGSRWSRGRGGGERGGKPGGRPPLGGGAGSGFSSSQSWREPSPPRKSSKNFGRSPSRKNYSSKSENCGEETFEDLLLKYKQIQLELEYINKDEKLALSSKEENVQEDPKTLNFEDQTSTDNVSITKDSSKEVAPEEKTQVKTFQAFELKPLRQKLTLPGDKNRLKKVKDGTKQLSLKSDTTESSQGLEDKEQNLTRRISASDILSEKKLGEEEEELSELQLRLLALQSASKKWQQKEQQVMKESKEKLTKTKTVQQKVKTSTKTHSAKKVSTTAKQALRKQQTKAWKKLQQQKEQERQKEEDLRKQVEEEERRKREEEIRKIRDLSNQEEQYNRFMKLVGGKRRSRSKSSDPDLRRSLDKQPTDSGGGIYQYDNYEEVAMDTDSETNSPAPSPVQPPFFSECSLGYFSSAPSISLPPPPQVTSMPPLSQPYVEGLCVSLEPLPPVPPLPPLPPEDPEQPPKPPFADEEEEEEMLLREELLKSLANKRAFKPEETSSNSDPPSPPVLSNSQPVPRSNLSIVSINTVSQPRIQNPKFHRGPRLPRTVISLPKHKSVVVTLNDSDDSESDGEASKSNSVFGGLESMIKEARRTAEQASKPKVPPKSEKENDPMRTPEALPEEKKIEYRLLKEEIANREKQRLIKSDQLKTSSSSPANSDVEIDGIGRIAMVTKQVSDAEAKLKKHRILLMKDESVLKNLIQQEAKKKESVRNAETKIIKLTEQLQATEKILNVNRMFLKKLQEQIQKVQQRITVKKALTLKYGEELARAKAVASKEIGKRKLEQDRLGPNKMMKLDNSPVSSPRKHSAELIAMEKRRLQKLEYEYALKIQKLKEARALKAKEQQNIAPVVEEELEFSLPQPSLHDLTQDKLSLDTEENDVDDEILSGSNRERRRSFLESNSFTKPNLKHTDTPNKECINKPTKNTVEKPELFLGLKIGELQKLYSKADSLKQLILKTTAGITEKVLHGQEISVDVDFVTAQSRTTEVKPCPFRPYHSPLLVFKSYRFSPYYRTKEKLPLSSVSYSNMIEPDQCFCRFDLTGTCNDDDCQWQHTQDYTLSRKQLFQDILSYNLSLIGCSETSTDEEIAAAAEKYVEKLFGVNKDRMSMDQMAVLLVSNINESKGHTPPFTTYKDKRKWKPKFWRKPVSENSFSSDEEQSTGPIKYAFQPENRIKVPALDTVVTPDDVRYFTNETDDIANLEASVLENPSHVQLWLKLAYKYLNQNEGLCSESLDSALNVLARALENNKDNPEIWCHYLRLFSKRGTKEEVQEMCETAVEYAPDYQSFWTFLHLESTFEEKDYVCERMVEFLMGAAKQGASDILSFQLLEALLFRVQLHIFTGRCQSALAILQNALKSANDGIVAEYLKTSDRCLAWLAYVHLIEFNSLPSKFYDPSNANPSRIVNTEPFIMPWQTVQDVKTNPDMLLAVFEDAVKACTDESLTVEERVEACMPIYTNMIALHQLLERYEAAVELCKHLLELCPVNCQLLEALVALYLQTNQHDRARAVWLTAFEKNPQNAEVFYYTCKFFILQNREDNLLPFLRKFIASFFKPGFEKYSNLDLFRYLLNIPGPLDIPARLCKGNFDDEMLNHQVPFLWMIYCYLVFANNRAAGSRNKVQEFKLFTDLVNRCLVTVPARYPIPFSSADYWSNYEFHNRVIYFYLSCVPKTQHSKTLERFCSIMPTNSGLALRLLHHEWEESNVQILKLQAKMFTYNIPTCLATWKIAIAAEIVLKGQREVHRLYQRALQKLPLCASLWKDQLLFEASEGGKTDNLRKLVSKCQEIGVSLNELLNLNSYKTESKNH
ncbi:zinc finger C3H1 domain-containing protein isoform X2 [Pteropus vampyrus]|uniref:Zinc finger C3H1 domain-containing protein isoform X2 n=1 Tax=Pteropus vampyrus TaxID=132908 RepID=A0A6P3R158_PTEVA|nr:zinc finger C3H1 domain-containing protein isoform X2 [Pteropus vampyrus]